VADREHGRGGASDGQPLAQEPALLECIGDGLEFGEPALAAPALELRDCRLNCGRVTDQLGDAGDARQRVPPALDDPAGIGIRACELVAGGQLEDLLQDVALRAERVVDRLNGDAGLGCDLSDRRCLVTALEEQARRGCDDDCLRLFRCDLMPGLYRTLC